MEDVTNNKTVSAVTTGGNSKTNTDRSFMRHMPKSVNYFYADAKAFSDKLHNYKKLKKVFLEKMKYELNLDPPRSYNEKIIWKKLFDRNPLLTVTADKYAVRDYLKKVLGEKSANEILIPVYYVTDKPATIPFNKLPDKFVIKPNHGSMMHLIVTEKDQIDRENIIRQCKLWLRNNFGLYGHEWAYRNIRRKIIIEQLLETSTGELPHDYKLYCFHGKCRMLRVTRNRFGREILTAFYDTDWNILPASVPGYHQVSQNFERPSNLPEMIELAEKLSAPFDYVRIDIYNVDSKIYFGELTHYEGSGLARFEPESFDFQLGKYWNIEPGYWRKHENN
jgi:hypothetical protein